MTGPSEQDIIQNLETVRRDIQSTSLRMGKQEPRLIAVSKMHPTQAIMSAYRAGQRDFGENYSQELAQKRADLAGVSDLRFVFIGRLQSNKIKTIVSNACEIQSLANLRHAALIAKAARENGSAPYPVYYLVNAGGEVTKDGLQPDEVLSFHQTVVTDFPDLNPQGIMAIPPPDAADASKTAPALYLQLRELASGTGAGKLSLGMSDDLHAAIGAGTDCVRIGTAIFGARA